MDFGGLDHYFNTLLPDSYSDFSPSHSSDTDTLSPSLSPSVVDFPFDVETTEFDLTSQWSFEEFPKQETMEQTIVSAPSTNWIPSVVPSLMPPNTNLLQPVFQSLPSFPTMSPSIVDPISLVSNKAPLPKKPRAKRRKLENEKEVACTPPSSPPAFLLSGEARLSLTRDELLSLTSAQYEALVSQVRSVRDLTPSEKRDIKNNRRLIKNRESAHASRQRKKDYVKELEKKLADMAQENERLTKTITAVQNENTMLRSENEYYKTRMQVGSLIPSVVQRGANFLSEQIQQQMPQVQTLQPQKSPKVSPNKASGVVLMVLLFSFGIMFGNFGFPGMNHQFATPSTVPEVLPRVYEREEFKQVSNTQFDVLSEEAIPSSLMRDRLRRRMAAFDAEEGESAPVAHKDTLELSKDATFPRFNFDPSFFKANTTYLYCNGISKLDPVSPIAEDPTSPKKISFLIPPSSLDGTADPSGDDLLVVTCEVTDVAMVPMVDRRLESI